MNTLTKIVLLEDIPHLGKKHEVKSVKFGFAKNWLIPRKLALLGLPHIIHQLQGQQALKEEKVKKETEVYESLMKELDGFTLRLRPKKTTKGTLYAAVDEKMIAEKLKEKGIKINEKYLKLKTPIKKVGEYETQIIFSDQYKANIKIIVQ